MRLLCNVPETPKESQYFIPDFRHLSSFHSLLQDLALCRLRVSKVHHLVEELVYDDEVIANTLFFQLFEVLLQYRSQLVQEEEDLGGIGIPPRESQHCEREGKGRLGQCESKAESAIRK